jgi:hypothetical protein
MGCNSGCNSHLYTYIYIVSEHYTLDCPIECQERRIECLRKGRGMSGSISGSWLKGCTLLAASGEPPSGGGGGGGERERATTLTQFADYMYRAADRFSALRGEALILLPPRHSKIFMASKRARGSAGDRQWVHLRHLVRGRARFAPPRGT